jgi:hypothetical protein
MRIYRVAHDSSFAAANPATWTQVILGAVPLFARV